MNVIDKYVKAIAKKYRLEESDIFVSQVESFVFHPEELEGVVKSSVVLEAPRLSNHVPRQVRRRRAVHPRHRGQGHLRGTRNR